MLNEKILHRQHFYILAVSGGPDSMFLLDNLRQRGYKFAVAHVNYHKREASNQEEKLVKEYCQTGNLPYFVDLVNPAEYSLAKNFQAGARQRRYDFFQKIAQQQQTEYIITAHHSDDHLETYLLQKQRKILVEYGGLSPRTRGKNVYILRPLISLNKAQIYQYLHQNHLPYCLDHTNYLPIYQRNVIRQVTNNFSLEKKAQLNQEIRQKNQELSQTKMLLKKKIKEVITNSTLNLNAWQENSPEIKMRLLYYWINKNTQQEFVNRKKNIWREAKKQLESPKKVLIIILNKNYQVQKKYPLATLEKQ